MLMKFAIVALAALGLTAAAVSDSAAQYRNDRSASDRQYPVRQMQPQQRTAAPYAPAVRTAPARAPAPQQVRPLPRVQAAKPAPVAQPQSIPVSAPIAVAPKPVAKPMPPLTEEQIAAKSAVDELLSRDPMLLAARELPDPRLARAAAARHDAEERKSALLRAKHEADEAKRRELTDRKAREDARLAALRAKPESQPRPTRAKNETPPPRVDTNRASVPAAPFVPAAPVRMPAPEGAPLARSL